MFNGDAVARGNFTVGPPVVAALRRRVPGAFLDCHLAVEVRALGVEEQGGGSRGREGGGSDPISLVGWLPHRCRLPHTPRTQDPATHVPRLAEAGASSITFQIEPFLAAAAAELGPGAPPADVAERAAAGAAALAADIRGRGPRAGVAVAPGTPLDAVLPLARRGDVDMVGAWGRDWRAALCGSLPRPWKPPTPLPAAPQVLCMTVECGWGGQPFQEAVLAKVAALRAACPGLTIQVDGGVTPATARAAAAAGANAVVAGTAVFAAPGGPAAAVAALRAAVVEGLPGGLARGAAARGAGAGAAPGARAVGAGVA
jgi:pentose-5-phosphate-3-epimerase